MADGKRVIATIYGPMGQVVQEGDQFPYLRLLHPRDTNAFETVFAQITVAINGGEAFIGPDRVARTISENPSQIELDTLELVLSNLSNGDLHLVPDRELVGGS